ncbi:MAG: hypothetical protein ACYS1A_20445 [Planctomycetota bacterium]|jgi:hypothetical protein
MKAFERLKVCLSKHPFCIVTIFGVWMFWATAFWYAGQGTAIATWLSIFFTVFVIIYMLIQGHEMRNLTEQAYRAMEEKTIRVEDLIHKSVLVANEPRNFISKTTGVSEATAGPEFRLDTTNCRWIVLLAFYAIAKAAQKIQEPGKTYSLDMQKITSTIHGGRIEPSCVEFPTAQMAIIGIILGLHCFLGPESITEDPMGVITIKSIPSSFVNYMLDAIQERINDPSMSSDNRTHLTLLQNCLDAYFEPHR